VLAVRPATDGRPDPREPLAGAVGDETVDGAREAQAGEQEDVATTMPAPEDAEAPASVDAEAPAAR
jgi:hypothetical protein